MSNILPKTPRELQVMLARQMGTVALVVGVAAGWLAYSLETRRTEQAALERATEGIRHFNSPAMQKALVTNNQEGHTELRHLLDRNRFIGIRVFGQDRKLIYEIWEEAPYPLVEAARAQQHKWPKQGESQEAWIKVGKEQLIQVVLPLFGENEALIGYVEGVTRIDELTAHTQHEQVRNSALTAIVSVIGTSILLYPLLLAMLRRSAVQSRRLLDANLSLLHSLGNAAAKRDSDTDAHNYRVTIYSVALAEAMCLSKRDISDLVVGAFLHDVGKIGIPDHILLKPGKLTADEFDIMKTHALLGLEIVAGNPWLAGAAKIIRSHHERVDGSGYPDGLRGESIPLTARIFAVVDVFDALTTERPYKKAMAFNDAMRVIERGVGTHFDLNAVTVFQNIAANSHAELVNVEENHLRMRMREILSRYF